MEQTEQTQRPTLNFKKYLNCFGNSINSSSETHKLYKRMSCQTY